MKFTDAERKQIEDMAASGVPIYQIAAAVRDGISDGTLKKHFNKAMLASKARRNFQIGTALFDKAVAGDTAALSLWAKTQMGWSETVKQEVTSPDGSMSPRPCIDVSKLSSAAMEEILLAAESAQQSSDNSGNE